MNAEDGWEDISCDLWYVLNQCANQGMRPDKFNHRHQHQRLSGHLQQHQSRLPVRLRLPMSMRLEQHQNRPLAHMSRRTRQNRLPPC